MKDLSIPTNQEKDIKAYSPIQLSQCFQVSRTRVRSNIKKFKEGLTVKNKPGRVRKQTTSKTLERKLMGDVSEEPSVTAKTLVNDLAKLS